MVMMLINLVDGNDRDIDGKGFLQKGTKWDWPQSGLVTYMIISRDITIFAWIQPK